MELTAIILDVFNKRTELRMRDLVAAVRELCDAEPGEIKGRVLGLIPHQILLTEDLMLRIRTI